MKMTIVLDFDQAPRSQPAIQFMQKEASAQLRSSGLSLDWVLSGESTVRQDMGEMLVFKMRGKCSMDRFPVAPDELGLPLAMTHSTEGDILTFGSVDCDRVRSLLKRTMSGGDYSRADYLYGRALGRVMAHEMYHMLARSAAHATTGVTRECLSSRELVREGLMMPDESLRAIRDQIALVKNKRNSAADTTSAGAIPPPSSLP